MNEKRILALVGSPRAKSTSAMLAMHLNEGLAARGWQVDLQRIYPAIRQPDRWAALEAAFLRADVVGLFTPLYVDALPSETTRALERLATVRQAQSPAQNQRFFALVNCGFFEAKQNDFALSICRQFARESGLQWSGGLALGAGGALGGHTLQQLGGMVRHTVRALELAVEGLDAGGNIPNEAQTVIRTPFCPPWLYFAMANVGMLKGAWDHSVLRKIHSQPYRP